MCVILYVNRTRPTDEMVQRAFDHNRDGAGVAWRHRGRVHWKKGITDPEEVKELCRKLPLPFVAHFRIASVGPAKPELTHPFSVDGNASLALEGSSDKPVLFHNGHWSDWNQRIQDAIIHSNTKPPAGIWSDTRAMALMAHIYGQHYLELLTSQKMVLFGPQRNEIYTGAQWEEINEVWCSNDFFWKRWNSNHNSVTGVNGSGHGRVVSSTRLCSVGRCMEAAQAGKEVCEKCEKKRQEIAAVLSTVPDTTTNKQTTDAGNTNRPLVGLLSVEQVQTLKREKIISKSMLKKFQKNYAIIQGRASTNQQARALENLRTLSEKVQEKLSHGSGA